MHDWNSAKLYAEKALKASKGNTIYKFDPKKDKNPSVFFRFTDENINNISRIAVNSDGTKLALVAEVSK